MQLLQVPCFAGSGNPFLLPCANTELTACSLQSKVCGEAGLSLTTAQRFFRRYGVWLTHYMIEVYHYPCLFVYKLLFLLGYWITVPCTHGREALCSQFWSDSGAIPHAMRRALRWRPAVGDSEPRSGCAVPPFSHFHFWVGCRSKELILDTWSWSILICWIMAWNRWVLLVLLTQHNGFDKNYLNQWEEIMRNYPFKHFNKHYIIVLFLFQLLAGAQSRNIAWKGKFRHTTVQGGNPKQI